MRLQSHLLGPFISLPSVYNIFSLYLCPFQFQSNFTSEVLNYFGKGQQCYFLFWEQQEKKTNKKLHFPLHMMALTTYQQPSSCKLWPQESNTLLHSKLCQGTGRVLTLSSLTAGRYALVNVGPNPLKMILQKTGRNTTDLFDFSWTTHAKNFSPVFHCLALKVI